MSYPVPTVSLTMIAYNASRYIQRAIHSIIAQTFQDWELIVVDDGSTDNTLALAYAYTDPRIRVIASSHMGDGGKVRNIGLRASRGAYLMSIDADDIHEPDAIETLLSHLQAHPECIGVYGFKTFIDENDNPTTDAAYDISTVDEQGVFHLNPRYQHTWKSILDDYPYCQVQALMFPRKSLETVGYYHEGIFPGEDTEYYLRFFAHSLENMHFIPKPVYKHRLHTGSISNDVERLKQSLNAISTNTEAILKVLREEAKLPYSRSTFITKQYKRYISIQLNHHHYTALGVVYRHALKSGEMKLGKLLGITLIEATRVFMPGLFHNVIRPLGKKVRGLLTHHSYRPQRRRVA